MFINHKIQQTKKLSLTIPKINIRFEIVISKKQSRFKNKLKGSLLRNYQ
jgi:hypothetical protein